MRIEIAVVPDCPNEDAARAAAREALASLGHDGVTVGRRVVADDDEARELGFAGSPSILVDGHDLFPAEASDAGLSCRVYAGADGPVGAPGADEILRALRARLSAAAETPAA